MDIFESRSRDLAQDSRQLMLTSDINIIDSIASHKKIL